MNAEDDPLMGILVQAKLWGTSLRLRRPRFDEHGALPGLGIFAVWLRLAFGGTHGTLAGLGSAFAISAG